MSYIKKSTIHKMLDQLLDINKGIGAKLSEDCVRELIDDTPTADVVEVRHGEWVWKFNLDDDDFFECSICGSQEVINGLCNERNPVKHYPYCHCGAKMDGERREENAIT